MGIKNSVTRQDIEDSIANVVYFTAMEGFEGAWHREAKLGDSVHLNPLEPLKMVTFCVLILKNGFTVTGMAVCADPANFSAETGKDCAYKKAEEQLWPLLTHELKSRNYMESL